MTAKEISDRFDYLAHKFGGGLMLDEYNKSLILTEAMYSYIEAKLSTYSYGESIDHVLNPISVTKVIKMATAPHDFYTVANDLYTLNEEGISKDIFSVLHEEIVRTESNVDTYTEVVPLSWNEYTDFQTNPFRKPDPSISYRLTSGGKFRIFTNEDFDRYEMVYCKIPYPIILEDYSGTEIKDESQTPAVIIQEGLKVMGYDEPLEVYNASTVDGFVAEPVLRDESLEEIISIAVQLAYQRIPSAPKEERETKEK